MHNSVARKFRVELLVAEDWAVGMSGYHFFLISGYLDILDTNFFLDTWIILI